MEVMDILQAVFRWVHIVAGIAWIGLLYFFNFINGQFAATMDGPTKQKVVPELLPRCLYWFRWGAAYTWVTGLLLLLVVFYHGKLVSGEGYHTGALVMIAYTFLAVVVYDLIFKTIKAKQPLGVIVGFLGVVGTVLLFVYYGKFTYRAYVIHLGAMFGTMMAYNVWMRIWPAQKKIIAAIKNGETPNADLAAMAGLRSKHNTYLSVPLIWTMINSHTSFAAGEANWYILPLCVAIGWAVVYWLYKKAAQVKGF